MDSIVYALYFIMPVLSVLQSVERISSFAVDRSMQFERRKEKKKLEENWGEKNDI